MYLNSNNPVTRPLAKIGILLAGLITAATLAVCLDLAASRPASATDLDVSATEEAEDGRFIRIGVNKSVVVRLPGEARDVIVGNPGILDAVVRTKNTAYLFARNVGQTNIFFFDREGRQILNLDVEVALDVTAIKKLLKKSLPNARITVDTANNSVILGGTAQNQLEAKTAVDLVNQYVSSQGGEVQSGQVPAIVNMIKIAGEDQVMLKVKVVEIKRDVLKQLGIDIKALIQAGSFAFNLSNINPFANTLISQQGGYKGVFANDNANIQSSIRAMESDGLLRTLAEPNLTAQSGSAAKFHAGGEFPFCVVIEVAPVRRCTNVEFREFGVLVDFTPTVLDEGRINLKIRSEVSDIGLVEPTTGLPTINKRVAETSLELPSGGSMMIGGLIQETTRQSISGTPGLKKLPVLGALFRSRDFIANETELVVMVTPYLVRHTAEKQLVAPDKGYNTPTDRQTIFLGRLNKVYGTSGNAPDGAYHGNVGFIVE